MYRDLSEFEKALSYSLEGKAIFERKRDVSLSSQVNDALQILYYYRTEYDKAITYGIEAVAQARKQTDPLLLLKPLINLSLSYTAKYNYEVSNRLLNEALELAKPMQNPRVDAVIMQNLGEIALKNYNIPQAEQYITKCLAIYTKIGDIESQSICLRGLSVCYLQSRNFTKALQYADSALSINRKNGFIKEEAAILREISLINYAMGDIKERFLNDEKSNLMIEDFIKKITSEKSANLEKRFETSKKESEIVKLQNEKKIQELSIQKKNQLNYVLMGGALILLTVFLLAYRNYKQKQNLQAQRISELEKEKQLLATEAVLKGESQERTRLAKDLHDGLGGMLSGIKFSLNTMKGNLVMTPENSKAFENSLDMLDSSISEMRRVAHNMMPEALVKFGLNTALKDFLL
ncbi:MAG: tetratricopeptide repeat protein [Chitinophagaceae bacterium]|nr:tetratricopeptide repeat protein [Chitinophagaceae bacterium]